MARRRIGQIIRRCALQPVSRADDHALRTSTLFFVGSFVALRVWSWTSSSPVLLARATSGRRTVIYGEFAQSSVSIVAVSLTVLAILYALPDRPSIQELRSTDTWPRLQGLLLTVALMALVTLIAAHIGTALDHAVRGIEWLEELMLAASWTAVLALLVGGIIFAVVLYIGSGPPDPSAGRGTIKRQWRL
jgi:hypothetical protein